MLSSTAFNDIEIALSLFPYKMAWLLRAKFLHRKKRNTSNRLEHLFDRAFEFNMKPEYLLYVVDGRVHNSIVLEQTFSVITAHFSG